MSRQYAKSSQTHDLGSYLADRREAVVAFLDRVLPQPDESPARLHQAARYAVFAGGKRLRPILALAVCEALGGSWEDCLPAAAATELIHVSSLIHDDLPCMDDADTRHGQPACHKVYGEALAVLVGDWLLTFPLILVLDPKYSSGLSPESRLTIGRELVEAVGSSGIIGGQVMDIGQEAATPGPDALRALHSRKTGRLLVAAARIGAIVAAADAASLAAVTRFAQHLGLAYQIADDVLDVVGDERALGKPVGGDAALQKRTYATLYGLERSRELAREAASAAHQALDSLALPGGANYLHDLIEFCVTRTY